MTKQPSVESPEKNGFKDTLNLPRTDFPMRPQPKIDDPAILARWQREHLYEASFEAHSGNDKFILHDGPPYANGHIHLGGAYNKILKDIACKGQRMSGKQVPVTPGWDCHGLPIELKVTKEYPGLAPQELRKQCRLYAQHWIDVQRDEFKQLGVLMNWEHPYLTMSPSYEAATIRAFGICFKNGFIKKKNKTVPWCASCQTVLAAAEIEYYERKDPSIYVLFSLEPTTIDKLLPSLKGKSVSFLVWTTTPWTLPLNRAVLLNATATYAVMQLNEQYILVAKPLVEKIAALLNVAPKIVQELPSTAFQGIEVEHPFIYGLTVPIILDPSVSLEDGTAAVHCAPGCGPEDYEVALKHNLEIFSPLSPNGRYTEGIKPQELEGMPVTDGQIWVLKKLQEQEKLLHKTSIRHSYPHCWRCRNGLIFRATQQWFLNLSHDNLRQKALDAIDLISFVPKRSRGFLEATIAGRLEWCISRQRIWGVPIPALVCKNCSYAYTSPEFIEKIAHGIEKYGIEYWDDVSLHEIMPKDVKCDSCTAQDFEKEQDILDVWFDSGISHYAVLYHNKELGYPADMYLEGLDQHRGWFQSSLLTSLAIEKEPCVKTIVTHGFTVDEKGHKMSKSLGNVITPQEIIQKFGIDVLRLWSSSIDFGSEAVVSDVLLKNIAEVYRRVRNTSRFLLSNLYDFDIDKDAINLDQMFIIDRYALEELFHVNLRVQAAYQETDFTAVFHQLADYCAKDLSAFYLDILKDRLYVEKADGRLRRSAQTACWYILDTLTKLIAPILSFTAEQVSDYYQKNKKVSIHLQEFNPLVDVWQMMARRSEIGVSFINWYPYKAPLVDIMDQMRALAFHAEREKQWALLMAIRSVVLKALEAVREKGDIKHSLDAQVMLHIALPNQEQHLLDMFFNAISKSGQILTDFFKEFFIVSQCELRSNGEGLAPSKEVPGLSVAVQKADGVKCPRCWQWHTGKSEQHLCDRCAGIV